MDVYTIWLKPHYVPVLDFPPFSGGRACMNLRINRYQTGQVARKSFRLTLCRRELELCRPKLRVIPFNLIVLTKIDLATIFTLLPLEVRRMTTAIFFNTTCITPLWWPRAAIRIFGVFSSFSFYFIFHFTYLVYFICFISFHSFYFILFCFQKQFIIEVK